MSPQVKVNHAPPRGRDGTALAHTTKMLTWWAQAGITRADLAVRRLDARMIWHHDLALEDLPFAWARAQNVRRADVYIRPARGHSWPLVFVDDVTPDIARRSAQKTSVLVVKTSVAGGCHLWVRCSSPLDERQRLEVQRWLARRLDGDRASVSGEHLGRLAGFKNWKRGGCWINVIEATYGCSWNPAQVETMAEPGRRTESTSRGQGRDTSASAREWGWVCGLFEAQYDPQDIYQRLLLAARQRGRREPERYANQTCRKAREWVARRIGTTPKTVAIETTTTMPNSRQVQSQPTNLREDIM
jgi:hypothetical protein